MTRYLIVPLAVLALAFSLAACGDDDGDQSADLDRYCELVVELDSLGAEQFAELEANPDATQEDYENLQNELIGDNEDLFDEIEDVAPEEIRDEVEILVDSVRARAAGEDPEYSDEEINDAEATVRDYERENCRGDEAGTTTDDSETTETEETTTTDTDETTTTETETDETTTTEDDSDETTTDDSGGVSAE